MVWIGGVGGKKLQFSRWTWQPESRQQVTLIRVCWKESFGSRLSFYSQLYSSQ